MLTTCLQALIFVIMPVKIKRIYEPPADTDGYRVLVDRLWPRGISKENAHIDKWLRDIAPSADLRKWFNHEPGKWEQFTARYHLQLNSSAALNELRDVINKHPTVTLLYGSVDEKHNQAAALLQLLG